jgi:hypothetical protein
MRCEVASTRRGTRYGSSRYRGPSRGPSRPYTKPPRKGHYFYWDPDTTPKSPKSYEGKGGGGILGCVTATTYWSGRYWSQKRSYKKARSGDKCSSGSRRKGYKSCVMQPACEDCQGPNFELGDNGYCDWWVEGGGAAGQVNTWVETHRVRAGRAGRGREDYSGSHHECTVCVARDSCTGVPAQLHCLLGSKGVGHPGCFVTYVLETGILAVADVYADHAGHPCHHPFACAVPGVMA